MRWVGFIWSWAVAAVAAAAVWAAYIRRRRRGLHFSFPASLEGLSRTWRVRLRFLPWTLRAVALLLLALALVRPQTLMGEEEVKLRGINIMLVTDLSGSMVAEDLKPNRITAEKQVLTDFVRRMPQDQIGLVVFGAKSFTQSPLTLDHDILRNAIQELDLNTVDADGTAIGDGILTAVNRLSEFTGQTNVIVLATDGTNNRGENPEKAVEIAAAKKIRLYIVGIGAPGGAPVMTADDFGMKRPLVINGKPMRWDQPNDASLQGLAAKTSGEYYHAKDEKELTRIYDTIQHLIKDEKQRRDPHYQEVFPWLLLGALVALALETLLSAFWLRSLL